MPGRDVNFVRKLKVRVNDESDWIPWGKVLYDERKGYIHRGSL